MVMSFPPLQPISDFHSYASGDVTIDPSAAIAPGVLLQADPDSRIAIAAGACIGMGSVLHAHKGTLIVETGATLGAGVLIVGAVKIGANACVGSVTTILNRDVERGKVIPPGSLLGDESRQLSSESLVTDEVGVYSAATQASVNSAVARNAIANPPIPESAQTDRVAAYSAATQASVNSAVARNAIANPPISESARTDREITDSPAPQNSAAENEAISDREATPESAVKDVKDKAGTYSSATQASINSAVARNAIANASQSRINANATVTPVVDSPESTPSSDEVTPEKQTSESQDAAPAIVYGQQHLERLMGTLFPYQSRNPKNSQSLQ